MTTPPPPGAQSFYIVTNEQIYRKVVELEKQVLKMSVYFSVIAFIVAPIISTVVAVFLKG